MNNTMAYSIRDHWVTLQRKLALQLCQRLFDDIARNPVVAEEGRRPRMSWGLALAYLVALLVHSCSVALGVLGVMLLVGPWNNLFVVIVSVALVALGIACRPRPVEVPSYLLSRVEYPVLHDLSDRVARSLGAPLVDGIGVSADFGANYRIAGWRRRRYVELGAPLLAILTPTERIAVIAHELAHGANGDPLRGQFLHGAVNTVATWASSLRPTSLGRLGDGMPFGPLVSIIGIPFELMMLLLSELLFLLAKGILLLVLRQSQRAEYRADLLAATVAGTAEMQFALEKTYLFDVVDAAIRTHALTTPDDAIGSKLSEAVHALSVSDLETYREGSRASNWQVDSTHPPTALRVDMLAAHPIVGPSQLLSADELVAFDAEVDRMLAFTQRELVNRKLEAIHG